MLSTFLHEVAKLANLNMLSKKQEKLVRSLKLKKNRELEQLFVAEGTKIVFEAIQERLVIHSLFVTERWLNENKLSVDYKTISEAEMQKISSLKKAPGVLALISFLDIKAKANLKDIILMLDDVKDPGNLGTIIRTAEIFGVSQIICSPETVDLYNEKVVQSSMGSIFRVPVIYQDILEYISTTNSSFFYASSLDGDSLYESELKYPACLIMGSESHGINSELLNKIETHIKVPQMGMVESMNVSIATAVILAEFRRNA
jgi:TrmH family RNA methyltransferase